MHQTSKKTIPRRKTRAVKVGKLFIGGDHPVSVQSMTRSKTEDWKTTVDEILELEKSGCEIIRCSANTQEAALALQEIKKHIHIPLVADIHFDYKLALVAIKSGVDKIRINPGNIGSDDKIKEVIKACKDALIPIRIGVNSGSLEKDILKKYGRPEPEALVESAMRHIEILEYNDFYETIVAMKSSSVADTISACRLFSAKSDYPQHLGITEAGSSYSGTIKSAIGIGSLLADGIGDTIRVSLTGQGGDEIKAGMEILKSVGCRNDGIEIISCPTCGRLEADLYSVLEQVEKQLSDIRTPLKVAVMGCLVNGPGEAKEADIGVTFGKDYSIIYVDGKSTGMIPYSDVVKTLVDLAREKSK
ncbi:MAG: flavodoxin-dependent (E)-4-hydroxy-3-methylbut-2-enyl-diphosphate synthase [Spirochaetia bacterium]|nr:flavodoxin-dependent (E)-4-hydroxy-3-methylbut-2-enyl-diphosphate synthase [Spirochaetia bacterium]